MTMTKSIQTVCVIAQLSFTSGFKMPHLNNFQKALIRNRLHDGVSIRTIVLELGVTHSVTRQGKAGRKRTN
jgi:hypothetical protein